MVSQRSRPSMGWGRGVNTMQNAPRFTQGCKSLNLVPGCSGRKATVFIRKGIFECYSRRAVMSVFQSVNLQRSDKVRATPRSVFGRGVNSNRSLLDWNQRATKMVYFPTSISDLFEWEFPPPLPPGPTIPTKVLARLLTFSVSGMEIYQFVSVTKNCYEFECFEDRQLANETERSVFGTATRGFFPE